MHNFPLGIILDGLGTDRNTAIDLAAGMGIDGLQMFATRRTDTPENLNAAERKALKKRVNDAGLVFSALIGDMGMGYGDRERNPILLSKLKKFVDLANDLGTNIVTTHIGVVPDDPTHERYKIMQDACAEIGEYAENRGSVIAIETGPERSETLLKFIKSLNTKGIGVNFDPANLCMIVGERPADAVKNLAEYIVHTHAKDGVMVTKANPEYIYGVSPMPSELIGARFYEEKPLGEGDVGFEEYLNALSLVGYKGFLVVERETRTDGYNKINQSLEYLKKHIGR